MVDALQAAWKPVRAWGIPPIYLTLAIIFLLSWLLTALFGNGDFLSGPNLTNILVRSVALGLVAIGQTFVILAGSIDLSVGYLISVVAVMASFTMNGDPSRVPLAILLVVVIALFVGLVNGLTVAKLRVNPFIATLATGLVMKGVIETSFQNFAGSVPQSFEVLAYGTVGPIPISVLLVLVVALIGGFTMQRTRFGAHLYAVGGNEETTRLSGIRTDRVLILAHIMASLATMLAGLFLVSELRAGAPWVGPQGNYDLESIAAVVVGGTALSGGRGSIAGTIGGVLIFGILDTLFNSLGVGAFFTQVLRGVIIIVAVASYAIRSKRAEA